MKTDTKKLKITISIDRDLYEKITAEADSNYGGNVSMAISGILINNLKETGALLEELESCHQMLARLVESDALPEWLEVETGLMRAGGKTSTYVKSWRVRTLIETAKQNMVAGNARYEKLASEIYIKDGNVILEPGGNYHIQLSLLDTTEKFLAWVNHLAGKGWMTNPDAMRLCYFIEIVSQHYRYNLNLPVAEYDSRAAPSKTTPKTAKSSGINIGGKQAIGDGNTIS